MIPSRFGAASSSRRAKPVLEVGGDPEAGEHAAERRRLEQHEHELERRVAGREVEAGHVADVRQAAREGDEEEQREDRPTGSRSAGLVAILWIERQATARATCAEARSCPHQPRPQGARRGRDRSHRGDRDRDAEAERERLAVPADDDERADALDQVGDRVVGGDRCGTSPARSAAAAGSSRTGRAGRRTAGRSPARPRPSPSAARRTRRARRTRARSAAPARAAPARRARPASKSMPAAKPTTR